MQERPLRHGNAVTPLPQGEAGVIPRLGQLKDALADEDFLHPPAGGIPHPSPTGDTFPKGEGWGCSLGASACYAVHIGGIKSYLYPQSQRPKPSPLGKVAERSEDG